MKAYCYCTDFRKQCCPSEILYGVILSESPDKVKESVLKSPDGFKWISQGYYLNNFHFYLLDPNIAPMNREDT
jgi:hypothetical protein